MTGFVIIKDLKSSSSVSSIQDLGFGFMKDKQQSDYDDQILG